MHMAKACGGGRWGAGCVHQAQGTMSRKAARFSVDEAVGGGDHGCQGWISREGQGYAALGRLP